MRIDSKVSAAIGFKPSAFGSPAPASTSRAAALRMVDLGEFSGAGAVTPDAGGQPDQSYDGHFLGAGRTSYSPSAGIDNIPTIKPENRPASDETIIFVNGMGSSRANSMALCQQVANVSGAQVIGIHNATEGTARDLMQCVTETFGFGKNPATDTLTDVIYDKLKAGQPVHVMGFSQGAIITESAIQNAKNRLMLEDGMSKADTEALMNRLMKVETIAGGGHSFPDGPKYVHYVNRFDPVAMGVGVGLDAPWVSPGKDAKIRSFSDFSWSFNPFAGHDFDKYMKRYVSFDQAYGIQ